MILYSEDSSPYCAPVRAAVYAKGLGLPIAPPPGGLKSDEYRRLTGTGTIPCLMLDDGAALPESAVIIAYLDEKYPGNPLRPADPEGRARTALILKLAEGEVLGPMVQLFHDLAAGGGDPAKALAAERMAKGLSHIEPYMPEDGLAVGEALTQADCVLAPVLFGVAAWAEGLGRPDLLSQFPRLSAYAPRAAAHPAIGRVLAELQAALAASGSTLG